ncbi:MAG: thioredoxin [Lachnospiraceae bacterium]|nr:thioredoxin [Lachnospiraceae bacterium]
MSIITATVENFEAEVLQSEVPVLVDFWASWCGPCRMLSPLVDKIAETAEGFKVAKVNVDEEMDLAETYGISSIPCLIVFKNGGEAKRSVGVIPEDEIRALVANA